MKNNLKMTHRVPKMLFVLMFMMTGVLFSQNYDVKQFGAVGDGLHNDTEAIQRAIDSVSSVGGKLVLSGGTYATGKIELRSNLEIEVQQGTTWKAIPDLAMFPEIKSTADMSQKGGYTMTRRAFIFGDEIENFTLSGSGTIYPSGDKHDAFPMKGENSAKRPYGIYIRKSKNITIKDVHLKSSAFWMMRFFLSTDIKISGIDIFNHANTNNDGIDIVDCHRVVISDCTIDSSDDALVFKSEAPFGNEDVVINNCILSSTASALKFGTGSFGGFKRIVASNIVIRPTRAEEVIHDLKIPEGISGIGIMSVDGADIEDMRFSNISIKGVQSPIFVRLSQRHKVGHADYSDVPITPGTINGLHFSNINARDCGPISANIAGYPGHYVENVTFDNIYFTYGRPGTKEDIAKEVPERDKGYPVPLMYHTNLPSYGFFFRHVKNVVMNNVSLLPAAKEERGPLYLEDVHVARINNVYGAHLKDIEIKDIIQKNVTDVKVSQ